MKSLALELLAYFDTLLASWPGVSGSKLRVLYLSRLFGACGSGCFVGPGCVFESRGSIRFGNRVSVGGGGFFNAVGGSISVGDRVSFNRNVHINASGGGHIAIGDDVLVGPNVVFRTADHRFDRLDIPIRAQGHSPADITVEDDVWLAANVIVLGGVRIGRGAVAAAGAVITRDVPAASVVGGVPAKILKMRDSQEVSNKT